MLGCVGRTGKELDLKGTVFSDQETRANWIKYAQDQEH
jgi:hypothetical protein